MSDDNLLMPFPEKNFRRANKLSSRGERINFSVGDNSKSSAQVETSVVQQVVVQSSGGLKPNESKPCRLNSRVTQAEYDFVVIQADKACMTISEYVRLVLVEPLQPPRKDPEKYRLLEAINRELRRQGNNLNQITRQFNADATSSATAEALIQLIARPLTQAYQAVRYALTDGRGEP